MLDLKFIRENTDLVRQGLAAKNSTFDLDELLRLDASKRNLLQEVENLKSIRNKANDEVTKYKKEGKSKEAEDVILSIRSTSQKIKEIDVEVGELSSKIDKLTYVIPNLPKSDVPISKDSAGNKVVRSWGKEKEYAFTPKDYLEITTKQGWLSMERGSKITGTAFPVYLGFGSKLQRALINFMLDTHTKKHSYKEVWPPSVVNRASMTGTGQLPKFEEDMYHLGADDYFLIPTAEVPVTNLLREETIEEKDLPIYFTAYTPCFRREAGSYGKDTKGLSRVHQFDKVELVKFVKPEDGEKEHESLVANAEAILQALELQYRVVLLSTGDMSFAAAKCYDLEVWAPVTKKWFEVSSCSLFNDFQSRRMNIRYRSQEKKKLEYVYTLNGSGLALPRIVLCLIETFQNKDGNVDFPKALQPYLA